MGRVAIASPVDEPGGPAAVVPPGGRVYARLRLEAPVVVARGDRFVLRRYSPVATIAGGLVLDPAPRRSSLRSPTGRARFEALDPGGESADAPGAVDRALLAMAGEGGREGLTLAAAAVRLRVEPAALSAAVIRLGPRRVLPVGEVLLATPVRDRIDADLRALLDAHHASGPIVAGLPREEARDRLRLTARVFDWILEAALSEGRVAGRERLVLPGRVVGPSPEERVRLDRIEALLKEAGLKPPDVTELAAGAGCAAADVERALAVMARERVVVRAGGLPFHRDALDSLKDDVRRRRGEHDGRIDVGTFKARYDVSRKYAIPLLEYLDRERVTRRAGEARFVL